MRRTIVAVLALAAGGWPAAQPASAAAFMIGFSGGIVVEPDLMACATLTGPAGETFVGTFTAVGVTQGPGTKVGTIRTTVPIVASGSWSHCIPGTYPGAAAGDAKFLLEASASSGEFFELKQCVVNRGAVTCV